MLSTLWWLPLAVGVVAIVPLARGGRRLSGEAAALRTSIETLRTVHPMVAEVQRQIGSVAATCPSSIEDLPLRYTTDR